MSRVFNDFYDLYLLFLSFFRALLDLMVVDGNITHVDLDPRKNIPAS